MILAVPAIFFISAVVQSTFGFGFSILTMPVLASFLSVKTAVPLNALVALVLNATVVASSWRNIQWKPALRFLAASTISTPLGIWIILYAEERLVKSILGVFLILYSLYSFLPLTIPEIKDDRWAYPFGLVAGILGGAYNVNGPPAIVYGAMRRWEPRDFRATLIGYFLPSGIITAYGHAVSGLWTNTIWPYFWVAVPLVLTGAALGTFFNKKINPQRFSKYLYGLTLLMGIFLVVTSI